MKHLFVTQDYGPDRGGMARRYVELCRRFPDDANEMAVSTVRLDGADEFDAAEPYPMHRQPFHFREANRLVNQMRWARWLASQSRNADVIHCGNIRPAGYAVAWAARRIDAPYIVYVNGGDLLREKQKARASRLKRSTGRYILGGAAGIVATSGWVAELSGEVMEALGISTMPPTAAFDLGTDPSIFSPAADNGEFRAAMGIGDDPFILTVARLVPHKGQDVGIRAVALLAGEFPGLRYVLVGEGHDEARLRAVASEAGVVERIIFAGPLDDAMLPGSYAAATVYLGASRIDNEINAEGFGISFLEASSSGVPVVAGDSGGVRSAVRDGETGFVVSPHDPDAIAAALGRLLRDKELRAKFGHAGRHAVETHYNWDRVARDTREFTLAVTAGRARRT